MNAVYPLFKALADEKRIKIAALIADRGLSVEEIASAVDLTPATVSHHLGRLRQAGLVEVSRQQYYSVYRFRTQPLLEAMKTLADRPVDPDLEDDLQKYDRKVLQAYMEDGRFKSIPAQRKKRDVLLRFLVEKFETGRKYTEKEVNLLIADYHEDFFTLRRELVDGRWMTRENGIYWRIENPTGERKPVFG